MIDRNSLTDEQKERALGALNYLLYDHEPETQEEIDAFLRAEGLDPEVIAERGRLFVQKCIEDERLKAEIERLQAELCAVTERLELTQHRLDEAWERKWELLARQQSAAEWTQARHAAAKARIAEANLYEDRSWAYPELRDALAEIEWLSARRKCAWSRYASAEEEKRLLMAALDKERAEIKRLQAEVERLRRGAECESTPTCCQTDGPTRNMVALG